MWDSIKRKLLIYMTVNIFIFTIVLLSCNIFLTKTLYIRHKKSILLESCKQIQRILEELPVMSGDITEDVLFSLYSLEREIGGSIFIRSPDGQLYYASPQPIGSPPARNPFSSISLVPPGNAITEFEEYGEKSFFIIDNDPNLKFETLRFQTRLENNNEILIWLPMSEISGSIDVFNRIVAGTAVVILIGTVLWSLFISNRFTKPIMQINTVAKKISMQDFSEVLAVQGTDEIAQLSSSINELSKKLHNTINQLNEKNLQLEKDISNEKKIDKMRKEFISGVSHELKTPIFLIQGYAEGLQKAVHDEEKRSFYCDVIISETEKMDKLLRDLLDIAQIESGMFSVENQNLDLVELSESVMMKFYPLFTEKGIKVEFCIPDFPDSVPVYADPLRMEQILVNYVNNAICHVDDRKEICVSIFNDHDMVKLSVFNSGKHIQSSELSKLWTAFYKSDQARSREYGGTGLGLSIVKAIQSGHRGGYGARNAAGGVEFWVTLLKGSPDINTDAH